MAQQHDSIIAPVRLTIRDNTGHSENVRFQGGIDNHIVPLVGISTVYNAAKRRRIGPYFSRELETIVFADSDTLNLESVKHRATVDPPPFHASQPLRSREYGGEHP